MQESNLAWSFDQNHLYADYLATNFNNIPATRGGNTSTVPINTDQHLMVWMRVGAAATIRKLYAVIHTDIPAGVAPAKWSLSRLVCLYAPLENTKGHAWWPSHSSDLVMAHGRALCLHTRAHGCSELDVGGAAMASGSGWFQKDHMLGCPVCALAMPQAESCITLIVSRRSGTHVSYAYRIAREGASAFAALLMRTQACAYCAQARWSRSRYRIGTTHTITEAPSTW